uniref:C2H2-type domain-containing protein n=1 Tax=Poecilia latipinna TaxID=48699 RepID=A0A3B3U484_9TELE
MVTVSGSLEIKGEQLELKLEQRNEDDCLPESQRLVKIEAERISQDTKQNLPKHELDSIILNVSGSLEIKEEPVELELDLMKEDDCQLGSQQMVKAEAEGISQDDNQEVFKQEISTVMVADSGSLQLKLEPGERDPEYLKEEDEGSGPQQMGKKEADNIAQEVLKQENETLTVTASGDESEYQQPELNGKKILCQNIVKAEHHQDIKTEKASGSSRNEQQQKRAQKSRGQCDDEEKMIKDKKNDKVKKCEKPFSCVTCRRSFNRKNSLNIHIRTHTGEKPFLCPRCGRNFTSKSSLNGHVRSQTGEEPFTCKICGKVFCLKRSLSRHIKSHTIAKNLSCEGCGKVFICKTTLTWHMKIHTGEKPFPCVTCGESFQESCLLTNHTRVHKGKKPFCCTICGKSFTRRTHLNIHIRNHTGEKPFPCGKSFSKKTMKFLGFKS